MARCRMPNNPNLILINALARLLDNQPPISHDAGIRRGDANRSRRGSFPRFVPTRASRLARMIAESRRTACLALHYPGADARYDLARRCSTPE